ncbi:hypothetical protein [Methanobrevibacter sp.]|uniref:hypothetical protein n=1 Tax=Methanobrevibacter sp. TaxID=66852 RepID=UPI00388DD96C
MNFSREINDELLEDFVYDYEDELEEVDVDEIIANLKNNISDYILENPDDMILEEPMSDIDFEYEEVKVPDEILEELEPKDNLLDYVDK